MIGHYGTLWSPSVLRPLAVPITDGPHRVQSGLNRPLGELAGAGDMKLLYVQALPNNIHVWGGSSERPMTWENTLRVAGPSSGNAKGTIVVLPGQGGPGDPFESNHT